MHSSDSIAPVGILHPLAFHLENKADVQYLKSQGKITEICTQKLGSVFEVQDSLEGCEATFKPVDYKADPVDGIKHKFNISRTNNNDTFSICCWLQDSSNGYNCSSLLFLFCFWMICVASHTSTLFCYFDTVLSYFLKAGLEQDLKIVLGKIESQLLALGFGWESVLYIHLYIDDMNKFSEANETYVKFITQEKCPFGVPSRSTVEIPLLEMGFSRAYIEVLVANNKNKKVLHVQSISSWAPSCIGPYSQVNPNDLSSSQLFIIRTTSLNMLCISFFISLWKLIWDTTKGSWSMNAAYCRFKRFRTYFHFLYH